MNKSTLNIHIERFVHETVITRLTLEGRLDGTSYSRLINVVRQLVEGGETQLILDLEALTLLGSAGLIALHQSALMLRGEPLPRHDFGWGAFHALERDLAAGQSLGLRVLRPSPAVIETMVTSGFAALVEPFANLDAALESFQPALAHEPVAAA